MTAKKGFEIEKEWITQAGLRAATGMNWFTGTRLGYVAVPEDHPLHGIGLDAVTDVHCHGGLTFSGRRKSLFGDLWCFGFDCNHDGDGGHPDAFHAINWPERTGLPVVTHEECVADCELIAKQLQTKRVLS